MNEHKDKKIIEALKIGIPISTIAKTVGVNRIYIYWRIKHNKEYQHANNLFLTKVENWLKS
jgi:predicted regulator of amino acid metabolism with ACT domain